MVRFSVDITYSRWRVWCYAIPFVLVLAYILCQPEHLLTGVSGSYLALLTGGTLYFFARALRDEDNRSAIRLVVDERGWCWFAGSSADQVKGMSGAWVIAARSRVFAGGVLLFLTQPALASRVMWVFRGECPECGLRRLSRVIVRLARQPSNS